MTAFAALTTTLAPRGLQAAPAGAASDARPSIAGELARFDNEGSLSRKARALLARLIQEGDFERCREAVAYIRGQVDQDAYPLLRPLEAAILGALTGDFTLLDRVLAGRRAADRWLEYEDPLEGLFLALQARVQEARRAIAAQPTLSQEDRLFMELLLAQAERADHPREFVHKIRLIDARVDAFLAEFLRSRRRPFVLTTLVERYRATGWFFGGQVLAVSRFGDSQELGPAAGYGFNLQVGYRGLQLSAGLHGSLGPGNPRLRQSLVHDGKPWPAGARTGWGDANVALGYRLTAGPHAVLLKLGLAHESFSEPGPSKDSDKQSLSFGAYLGALEYQLVLTRSPLTHQPDSLAIVRVSATRPSSTGGQLSSSAVVVELGVGYEIWQSRRITQ
jgi:hypothetical protein